MYLGKIVEIGTIDQVFDNSKHPYTKMLLDSIPIPDPKACSIKKKKGVLGEIPSPLNLPRGCKFHTRCPCAKDVCKNKEPEMVEIEEGHFVRCYFAEEMQNDTNCRSNKGRIK